MQRSWMKFKPFIEKVRWEGKSSRFRYNTNAALLKVEEVLHMEGGQGVDSYSSNSSIQKRVMAHSRQILEESVKEMCETMSPKTITIAELGCSSGPNAFEAIWNMINVTSNIYETKNVDIPEYCVFLNDLMGNDFNNLYRTTLPDFQQKLNADARFGPCFVSGSPGSFYGRLFPSNSLHLVHSSSSVHFLSQVPKGLVSKDGEAYNKGVICMTKESSRLAYEAYYQQFADDFTVFLSSRAKEIVPGGRMILTFRTSTQGDKPDNMLDLELLGLALKNMVIQGKIREESLDNFNMPLYAPSIEEVEKLIKAQGSFSINKQESFTTDWSLKDTNLMLTAQKRAKHVTNDARAYTGPILAAQFGMTLLNDIFQHFEQIALECFHEGKLDILCTVFSLERN